MNRDEILAAAGDVFDREIAAVAASKSMLDDGFVRAVEMLMSCTGKVVTMGIGKSGHVARKIAATLSSTGTQSVFVHPVECMHGDMGMIGPQDLILLLSNSGESDEIRKLMLFLRSRKLPVIAVTARRDSHLAQSADTIILYDIPQEACPMGMAPMASTTVQMIIGDALAAVLIRFHNFNPDNFAEFHPAGTLGKRLLLKVGDLMHTGAETPLVTIGTPMRDALVTMTGKAMGAVIIVSEDDRLAGIITDGDLRRAIPRYPNILEVAVENLMTRDPIRVNRLNPAIDALRLMERRSSQIAVLPVVDDSGRVCGIIRLHDLVIAGL